MLGSIFRYPRLSMIQGCPRYGGNSSAAILGNNSCGAPLSTRERSRPVRREYAFIGNPFALEWRRV